VLRLSRASKRRRMLVPRSSLSPPWPISILVADGMRS
jgi:hypothetical protein